MSNFKSGSGDLSFGGEGSDDEEVASEAETEPGSGSHGSTSSEPPAEEPSKQVGSTENDSNDQSVSSAHESVAPSDSTSEYPYFVRRHNVGDERDVRLEIFLRDGVANKEGQFRSELAECLETNEVAKTDAREFALLRAFQDPEGVAELMREEGYGTFD
ncbi:acyl-CoA dehydrogenase [Halococcus salsus]|uniref:acyl-CoA dehydrogenase n=1 Tax=Halococcus salsus TaxID=2162894 RepID=UPI001359D7F1|nr:acyl-CoA dehydrogenase [Halococcus salsus]